MVATQIHPQLQTVIHQRRVTRTAVLEVERHPSPQVNHEADQLPPALETPEEELHDAPAVPAPWGLTPKQSQTNQKGQWTNAVFKEVLDVQ